MEGLVGSGSAMMSDMHFAAIGNGGARLIQPQVHSDERGSFMRSWCRGSFLEAGIDFTPIQGNCSHTGPKHAVRGMHFQREPRADAKIVRCTRGRIFDVIVDLREDASSRGEISSVELSAADGAMLYVPAGFAHGFQTLDEDTIVEYLISEAYAPELYDGYCFDDPALPIDWPHPVSITSENDRSWPSLASRMAWLEPVA